MKIDDPAALRALAIEELPTLAKQLREELIGSVAASGGHLASGLGTVELAVALHYVYDTPRDALVWDVGHQAYPHKMLTGRRDKLATIRRRGGISGFLKRDESPHDAFGAGHSSTSISAALGIAVANRRLGVSGKAIAIIGDGALTAGLAYEALHHAGGLGEDLVVVLNDNGMSISENVGALARHLGNIAAERIATPGALFEALGFDYSGPIDGHDVTGLVDQLQRIKLRRGPQLLHVLTCKGAGYERAEQEPIKYHGVTPFDPAQGLVGNSAGNPAPTYTQVFGDWLCEMARHDPKFVVITPAMREGSGLVRFAREFPDRYFDVGIAEQHAVTFAAGLATRGLKPIVAIYSTFLQRAFDQMVHDVCLQNLPVLFAIDRGGLVGPDGATHNGGLDLTYLRCVPGMTVMTPSDAQQLRAMLRTGLELSGPSAIRYPRCAAHAALTPARGLESGDLSATLPAKLPIGRGQWCRRGSGIALFVFGTLLDTAHQLAESIDASVIDMRFVKPLDEELILEVAKQHALLVTLEENVIAGGAGSAVMEYLARAGREAMVLPLGLPDANLEHGTRDECLREAGLDLQGLFDSIARHAAAMPTTARGGQKRGGLDSNMMFNGVTRSLTRFKLF